MKLLKNKKVIILSMVIAILLIVIGMAIYGIYSNNKKQTIAEPVNEEVEENKNIIDINNIEEITR